MATTPPLGTNQVLLLRVLAALADRDAESYWRVMTIVKRAREIAPTPFDPAIILASLRRRGLVVIDGDGNKFRLTKGIGR